MTDTIALLPCPFCGSDKPQLSVETADERNGYRETGTVSCSCGAYVSIKGRADANGWSTAKRDETRFAAMAVWNRRIA